MVIDYLIMSYMLPKKLTYFNFAAVSAAN
jgi:hypothetical protein